MAQIKLLQIFQIFEEMEEALGPVSVVINQRVVRQVEIASTGHSGESPAENVKFIILVIF